MPSEPTSIVQDHDQPFTFEPTNVPSNIGVLCVHGFTGTPNDMRPLGEALVQAGIAAHCPLLPGHGSTPSALKHLHWRHWVEAARDALHRMRQTHAQVFIAGLSMGGLITLHLAVTEIHTSPMRGIIVLAAPSAINDPRARLVRFARHVVPWHYPLRTADFDDPAVQAEVMRRSDGMPINFDDARTRREIVNRARIPLTAIHELMQLNATVMRELPCVNVPALFFQGRRDTTVAPDSADVLVAGIASTDKRVVWLPKSGHVLPHEPDAPTMFAQIADFVRAHLEQTMLAC